jgi:hypothetical protein
VTVNTHQPVRYLKGGHTMTDEYIESKKRTQFVWVKDKAGNEYVCDVGYLKDPKNVAEEELKDCVDDASVYQASAGG